MKCAPHHQFDEKTGFNGVSEHINTIITSFNWDMASASSVIPKISVLIPTFNSEKYIKKCIESVLEQTFTDFEIIIVDDSPNNVTGDAIRSFDDPRIRIIEGPQKGLSEALNIGINNCNGEYIARLDSDDYSDKSRFEKQVNYLDAHENVVVCGSWQLHYGKADYIHKPAISPEQCKSNLLFTCDLCHSTVMFRRRLFVENDLFYSSEYLAEDFELWTRVLDYGDIANIPEILGYYRHEDNITTAKRDLLVFDEMKIVAKTLKKNLNLVLSDEQKKFFVGYTNPFFDKVQFPEIVSDKESYYSLLKNTLMDIYNANNDLNYYDKRALLNTLYAEWRHLRYDMPFFVVEINGSDINRIFDDDPITLFKLRTGHFMNCHYGIIGKVKAIIQFGLQKIRAK